MTCPAGCEAGSVDRSTRREHRRLWLEIGLILLGLATPVCSQDSARPFLEFIQREARTQSSRLEPPVNLATWESHRTRIREALLDSWGGFPDKPADLDPQVLDVLERDGYRVEKILFQTFDDVWMPAHAYVPQGDGPFPAVLCVHGHWREGKQAPHLQARSIGLAKLGFFVLAVDAFGAGERGLGKALGEYHGEMVAATLLPVGKPLSGLQVYENMRAVDYLLTRPEVNGERIGVTGASGGGNQTMYVGAWDERLKAVVPVCSVGNYQAYLGPACCMCEVVPGILPVSEEWGVLSLTAPRALMVVNATRDGIQFSVGEAKKSLRHVDEIYAMLDAKPRVNHRIFESPHAYNQPMREAMYGWMTRHLKGEGDGAPIPEPEMTLEDPETLRCFPGESRPDDWMTLPQFAHREGQRLIETISRPKTRSEWEEQAASWREQLAGKTLKLQHELGANAATLQDPVNSSDRIQVEVVPGLAVHVTAKSWPPSPDRPCYVVLTHDGAESPEVQNFTEQLPSANADVLTLELRGTGAQRDPRDKIGRAPDHNTAEWSLWIGRPLLGQWIDDVRALINALEQRGQLTERLILVGLETAAPVALMAGGLDPRIDTVVARSPLASYVTDIPYEGQRLGLLAPGILRDVGDIPHVSALIAPRRLIIAGGVSPAHQELSADELNEAFTFTKEVYGLYDPGALSMIATDQLATFLSEGAE